MCLFFFNDTATTEIYTLSLHDALPISIAGAAGARNAAKIEAAMRDCLIGFIAFSITNWLRRSEEHTSELQSRLHLVCRLLLEKKKTMHLPSEFKGASMIAREDMLNGFS